MAVALVGTESTPRRTACAAPDPGPTPCEPRLHQGFQSAFSRSDLCPSRHAQGGCETLVMQATPHTFQPGAAPLDLMVLIPAYNEEQCIADVLRELWAVLPG